MYATSDNEVLKECYPISKQRNVVLNTLKSWKNFHWRPTELSNLYLLWFTRGIEALKEISLIKPNEKQCE